MIFVKAIDHLPWYVKLLLCLPIVDIIWAIYRIVKGVAKSNAVLIVAGILWIVLGGVILWLIDLVCIIIYKQIKLFA